MNLSDAPHISYSAQWRKLRREIEDSMRDGANLDAELLLARMDVLKQEALRPFREWVDQHPEAWEYGSD